MKLRLGQAARATDGQYGRLADIVIDPQERTVTHLVVEPHHRHQQARLVAMDHVEVVGDTVEIDLAKVEIRTLPLVSRTDFVRPGHPIQVEDGWDIGTEDVVALPFWGGDLELPDFDVRLDVTYDRIPKGDCEIRRKSIVETSDGATVGTVEGFMADGDHLTGVMVRTRPIGLRRRVVVPMSGVAAVRNDVVTLSASREDFRTFPAGDSLAGPSGRPSRAHDVEAAAGRAVTAGRGAIESALDGMQSWMQGWRGGPGRPAV